MADEYVNCPNCNALNYKNRNKCFRCSNNLTTNISQDQNINSNSANKKNDIGFIFSALYIFSVFVNLVIISIVVFFFSNTDPQTLALKTQLRKFTLICGSFNAIVISCYIWFVINSKKAYIPMLIVVCVNAIIDIFIIFWDINATGLIWKFTIANLFVCIGFLITLVKIKR